MLIHSELPGLILLAGMPSITRVEQDFSAKHYDT